MSYAIRYYDEDGNVMDRNDWAKAMSGPRHVGKTDGYDEHGNEVFISTVWLGMDHNFSGEGAPLIFETMVFGLPDEQEVCVRYATREEAKQGHALTCGEYLARPIIEEF